MNNKKILECVIFIAIFLLLSNIVFSAVNYINTIGGNNISIGNNSQLFVDNTNSYVGIGTTGPGYKLDVAGNVNAQSGGYYRFGNGDAEMGSVGVSGGNELYFKTFQTGDYSERMRITKNGNVGIGTTGPQGLLHINKSQDSFTGQYITNENAGTLARVGILVGQSNSGSNYGAIEHFGAGFTTDGVRIADRTSLLGWDTGGLAIGTYTDYPVIFAQNNAEVMRISDTGNIGIGTTNPGSLLQVAGNANITGNIIMGTASALEFRNRSNTGTFFGIGTNSIASDDFLEVGDNSASSIQGIKFYPGLSSPAMTILTSSGNVGIGTTGPFTNTRLDVRDSKSVTDPGAPYNGVNVNLMNTNPANSTVSTYMFSFTDNGYGGGMIFEPTDQTNHASKLHFATRNGGSFTPRMTIDKDGNVGIGTTGPTSKLYVVGNDATWAGTFRQDAAGGYGLSVDCTACTTASLYTLAAYTNTGTGLFVLNNGNVGIGTTSPNNNLEVIGKITGVIGGGTTPNGGATGLNLWGNWTSNTALPSSDAGVNYGMTITNGAAGDTYPTGKYSGITFAVGNGADSNAYDYAGIYGFSTGTVSTAKGGMVFGVKTSTNTNTAMTAAITINDAGKVGIGNTIPNNTMDISGNLNVSGRISYGTLQANSPHFFATEGDPEPICIKASTGKYVGCMVDENMQFACSIDERCNRKYLYSKLEQDISSIVSDGAASENINESSDSSAITGNAIKNRKNSKEEKKQESDDLRSIKDNVQEKTMSVKDAIAQLKGKRLKYTDLNEIIDVSEAQPMQKFTPSKPEEAEAAQQPFITQVNGSVIIRLG